MHWEENLEKVLERINKIQNLPDSGLLAGGALANIFWEYQSNNKAIINDIDIFLLAEVEDNMGFEKSENFKNIIKLIKAKRDQTVVNEHRGDREYKLINNVVTSDNHIRIMSSYRDKHINYVEYKAYKYKPLDLISTFDINCTQIAYDLNTKTLHYTAAFSDFMNNGKLKITNANTGSHTAIRMYKKCEELNVDFDEREEFGLLYLINSVHVYDYRRVYFSEKYAYAYKRYISKIRKYFILKQKDYDINVYVIISQKGVIPTYNSTTKRMELEVISEEDKAKNIELLQRLENFAKHYKVKDKVPYDLRELFLSEVLERTHDLYRLDYTDEIGIDEYSGRSVKDNSDVYIPCPVSLGCGKTIDEITYYYRNIRNDKFKKKAWFSGTGIFWKNDYNYITDDMLINKDEFLKKLNLIIMCLTVFPPLEKTFKTLNFEEQYNMCSSIIDDIIVNKKMFFFYKFYTGNLKFETVDEKKYESDLTRLKYRHDIHRLKTENIDCLKKEYIDLAQIYKNPKNITIEEYDVEVVNASAGLPF